MSCDTKKLKVVKQMSKLSPKFEELISFFDKLHMAVEDGKTWLRDQKAKLKRFIFEEINSFKSHPNSWVEKMERM